MYFSAQITVQSVFFLPLYSLYALSFKVPTKVGLILQIILQF